MKRNEQALSNEIYENNEVVVKKLIDNYFKTVFSRDEIEVIESYNKDCEIIEEADEGFVMTRVPGKTKSKYTDNEIVLISNELKKFHKVKIDDGEITPFKEAYEFLGGKKDISKAIEILNDEPVLLHNDLVEGNILIDGNNIKFIDFEYSNLGNKLFDIVSFATERYISKEQIELWIDQFDIDMNDYEIVKEFLNEFWILWAEYMYNLTDNKVYNEIIEMKKSQ